MKRCITIIFAAVLLLSSSSAFAQKFGIINSQELMSIMPEMDSVQVRMTAYIKELESQLETIQVESNVKYEDYQKNLKTYSESVRQLKEKELQDLQSRYESFRTMAQQDIKKMQDQLMEPVLVRARDGIKKVSASNGFLVVFDESSSPTVFVDETKVINLLPLVKAELGIKDKPAAPATAPAKQAAKK